jgi:hypothetical protein
VALRQLEAWAAAGAAFKSGGGGSSVPAEDAGATPAGGRPDQQALSRTYQLLLRGAHAAGERQGAVWRRLRRAFRRRPLIAVPWSRLQGVFLGQPPPQPQPEDAAAALDGGGGGSNNGEPMVFFRAEQLVACDPGGLLCGRSGVLPPALDALYQGEALELLARLLPGGGRPGGGTYGAALVAAAAAGGGYEASVALLEALGRALLDGEPLSWGGGHAEAEEVEAGEAGEAEGAAAGPEEEEEEEQGPEEGPEAAGARREAAAESWRRFFRQHRVLPCVTGAWVGLGDGPALSHEALLSGRLPEAAGEEGGAQLLRDLLASAELSAVQLAILGPPALLGAAPAGEGQQPAAGAAAAAGGPGLRHLLGVLRVPSLERSLARVAAGASGAPLWLQDAEQIAAQQQHCRPASLLLQQLLPVAQRYLQLHDPARSAQLCADPELAARLASARAFLVPGLQVGVWCVSCVGCVGCVGGLPCLARPLPAAAGGQGGCRPGWLCAPRSGASDAQRWGRPDWGWSSDTAAPPTRPHPTPPACRSCTCCRTWASPPRHGRRRRCCTRGSRRSWGGSRSRPSS